MNFWRGTRVGVSLSRERLVRDEIRSGIVNLIAFPDVDSRREPSMIFRRDRTLPRTTTDFASPVQQKNLRADSDGTHAGLTARIHEVKK
jgi:hypothetical protein